MHVPIALYELLSLAEEIEDPKGRQMAQRLAEIITVTLEDPDALVKLGAFLGPRAVEGEGAISKVSAANLD